MLIKKVLMIPTCAESVLGRFLVVDNLKQDSNCDTNKYSNQTTIDLI